MHLWHEPGPFLLRQVLRDAAISRRCVWTLLLIASCAVEDSPLNNET